MQRSKLKLAYIISYIKIKKYATPPYMYMVSYMECTLNQNKDYLHMLVIRRKMLDSRSNGSRHRENLEFSHIHCSNKSLENISSSSNLETKNGLHHLGLSGLDTAS